METNPTQGLLKKIEEAGLTINKDNKGWKATKEARRNMQDEKFELPNQGEKVVQSIPDYVEDIHYLERDISLKSLKEGSKDLSEEEYKELKRIAEKNNVFELVNVMDRDYNRFTLSITQEISEKLFPVWENIIEELRDIRNRSARLHPSYESYSRLPVSPRMKNKGYNRE